VHAFVSVVQHLGVAAEEGNHLGTGSREWNLNCCVSGLDAWRGSGNSGKAREANVRFSA
jgi:hypothetical protein